MYVKFAFALVPLVAVTFMAGMAGPSNSSFAAGLPQGNPNAIRSVLDASTPHRGSLDRAFGKAGKVVTNDNNTGHCFVKGALQPDGKVVAVDCVSQGWLLLRYLANGSLDPSFGRGGLDVTRLNGGSPAVVTVQSNGKILVAGNLNRPSVVRFNSDGTLDRTFGNGGIAGVTFPNGLAGEALSLVVQSDGKIVMGGDAAAPYPRSSSEAALVRFLSNGKVDRTFGENGLALVNGGGQVSVLAVAQDGTFDALTSVPPSAVQALHFSEGGRVLGAPPTGNLAVIESTSSITFQPDAKIVLGQSGAFEGPNQNARFTRFNSLDPNFQTPFYNFGQGTFVNAIAVEPNGGIVTAGSGNQEFALGRFNPNGSIDTGFGNGGLVTTTFFTGAGKGALIEALLIQPDGKIVALGNTFNNPAGTSGIALARYFGP